MLRALVIIIIVSLTASGTFAADSQPGRIPPFAQGLSTVELEIAWLLQKEDLFVNASQYNNDLAKRFEDGGSVEGLRRYQQAVCLMERPEQRRLAEAAVQVANQYRDDPLRWDAVVIAADHLDGYRHWARWNDHCLPYEASEQKAGLPLKHDAFFYTKPYRDTLRLVDELLREPDVPLITFLKALDQRVEWIKEGFGDDPGWDALVKLYSADETRDSPRKWVSPQAFESRLAEVRALLEKLEQRLPPGGIKDTTPRYGRWPAHSEAFYYYARMLHRAMVLGVLQGEPTPAEYLLSELERWNKLASLLPPPYPGSGASYFVRRLQEYEAAARERIPLQILPSFTALGGRTIDLSRMQWKALLLHFWSVDDPASLASLPSLKSLHQKYHDRGLSIVGVSLDSEPRRAQVQEVTKDLGWPQHFDGLGRDGPIAASYDITDLPRLLLLDSRRALKSSRSKGAALEREIGKLVALPPFEYPSGSLELVPYHSIWHYLDTGERPAVSWTADEGVWEKWPSGPSALGYNEIVSTPIRRFTRPGPDPQRAYATAFFVRTFDVPAQSAGRDFVLNLRVDDGAVIYLNGQEISRVNMGEGPVTHQTPAAGPQADDTEIEVAGRPGLLRAGRNVLAVSLHNHSPISSDLFFDLRLVALPARLP